MASLATADILLALTVMPWSIYQEYQNSIWNIGDHMCKLFQSLDIMLSSVSILHLSFLSADRYVAICKPFQHHKLFSIKRVCFILMFCWFLPGSLSFAVIFTGIGATDNVVHIEETKKICFVNFEITFRVLSSIVTFYLPSLFMLLANLIIYRDVRRTSRQISRSNDDISNETANMFSRRETKVAKTIAIMMGCFFCCWIPFFVFNSVIYPFLDYNYDTHIVWGVVTWLGYINSMLNPLLFLYFDRMSTSAARPPHVDTVEARAI